MPLRAEPRHRLLPGGAKRRGRTTALLFALVAPAGLSCTPMGQASGPGDPAAPPAMPAGAAGAAGSAASPGTAPTPPPAAEPGAAAPMAAIYPEGLLCPAPRAAADAGGLSAGFAAQCAGCHGARGEGRAPFPALDRVPDVDTFIQVARTGRKEMPPFDGDTAPDARLAADFHALAAHATAGANAGTPADPDCGLGWQALPRSSPGERRERIRRGMVAYRKEGPKGACAGCHSVVATDLAFVGFSDADILRRAIPQLGVDDARAIVDLVHALREQHQIDRPLHPRRFRFLQPGHEVLPELLQPMVYPEGKLPGEHDAARDAAFARSLEKDVGLLLLGDPIRTLAQAQAAQAQLRQLDLHQLRVGVPFPRWTEDGFHGSQSNVPNEWVAMLARHPVPGGSEEWLALVDGYLADPSDANLWRMYDAIETRTAGETGLPLATRWSLRKFQSVQVAAHALLHRTQALPDPLAGSAAADAGARRLVQIAHNPFWRVGDSVRQNPFNCNQPEACLVLPPALDATMNPGALARERQSYEEKMSWFWLGFTLDPALVATEDSLATVSGDYFLALSQPWYQVHNAFVVVSIVTAKANARDYFDAQGIALPGHGRWASPRPFMAFKHSERELHHPPRVDLRYPIHERLWGNGFRMFLWLMNDEVGRTGQVFDRAGTLASVDYMRRWFDTDLEVGQDHRELDALVAELRQRLTQASEIGLAAPY